MFLLELPHQGDSNEYTQYTIFNINKKGITLKYPISVDMGFFFQLMHQVRKQNRDEYTQYNNFNINKKEITLNYPISVDMGFFQGTRRPVPSDRGKRVISVPATEDLLYVYYHKLKAKSAINVRMYLIHIMYALCLERCTSVCVLLMLRPYNKYKHKKTHRSDSTS